MNTKGTKFLAVLAVLAVAFSVFAVVDTAEADDAASSVTSGTLTFDFATGPENFDMEANQDLSAEISGSTITLKGQLYKISGANATMTTAEWGYDVAPDYGIAFSVSGFDDVAQVKLNNNWLDKVDGYTHTFFQALGNERELNGATSFTVSIDSDGNDTIDRVITINFANLIHYKSNDKLWFEYADAEDASNAIEVYQNASIMDKKETIAVSKIVTVPAGKILTVESGNVLTINGTLTVNGSVVLEDGAAIVNNGTINNPGNIKTSSSTNVEIVSANGVGDNTIDKIVAADETAKKDSVVAITSNDAVNAKATTVEKNNLTLVYAGAADLTGIDMTIKATGSDSKSISFAGFNTVSGTITTTDGTKAQTMTLTSVKGDFTVSKGSLIIDGEIVSGAIELADKAEAKVSGDVTNFAFTVADGKTAKIIIDNELDINGAVTVGTGIAVEINGTLGSSEEIGSLALAGTASMTINSGAKVTGNITITTVSDSTVNTIYSGSDVNGMNAASTIANFTGKDASSGKWTYDDVKKTLVLDNYKGTYNFAPIAATLEKILLIGSNEVSYVATADHESTMTMFGNNTLDSIKTDIGTGYLTVNADLSAASGEELGLVVFSGDDLVMDEVTVIVNVTGSNNTWTPAQKESMIVIGIESDTLVVFNSKLTLDIMSTYGEGCNIWVNEANLKSALVDIAAGTSQFEVETIVSNSSIVSISGEAYIAALTINQESFLTLDKAMFSGDSINKANLTVTGDMLIEDGASFINEASLSVQGKVTSLGELITKSDMESTGTIEIIGNTTTGADGKTIAIATADKTKIAAMNAVVDTITLTTVADADPSGVGLVTAASVTFAYNTGEATGTTEPVAFVGMVTPAPYGAGYTVSLETMDGKNKITVTYDGGATKQVGKAFAVSASGKITYNAAQYTLAQNIAESEVTDTTMADLFDVTDASFSVNAGTFTNTGSVIISSTGGVPLVAEGATYQGPVTINVDVTINGELNGAISSNAGDITVGATGVVTGDAVGVGAFTVDGEFHGDITTEGVVTINNVMAGDITTMNNVVVTGEVIGDITIDANGKNLSSTAGTIDGTLTYNYTYKATKGSSEKTSGTATVVILGKATYQIDLVAPVDSNETTDGVAGYIAFDSAPAAVGTDGIEFTFTSGKFGVPVSIVMPAKVVLVVEAGTTIEVAKSQSLDVIASALKISGDAIVNIDDGAEIPDYGTVTYVMKFTTKDNYTIYSNVAYALSNCDENTTLTVASNAVIPDTTPVDVKKGVNVVISDGVVVDFAANALTMQDGAKITLMGTGSVLFAVTGDNGLDGAKKVYYYVSGTFEFDDGANSIVLDKVRFTEAASIAGIPAVAEEPSMLNVTLKYNTGVATLVAGNATGAIGLGQTHAIADTKTSGTFVISEGTVCSATVEDVAKVGTTDIASKVTVNGTLNVPVALVINGEYDGAGEIVLNASATAQLIADSAVATVTIADSEGNGYAFDAITPTTDIVVTAVGGESAYVKIAGVFNKGTITALDDAVIDAFTVDKGAIFIADSVEVLTASVANGELKTKAMDEDTLVNLEYDSTYTDGDYTVYSKLANIDLTKVSNVVVEKADFELPTKLEGTASITIKEGVVATVPAGGKVIIGDAPTEIGAGIVLAGKVKIPVNSYMIVYPGADISALTILSADAETEPVKSTFDIDGSLYATVYASKTAATEILLAAPAADLKPAITGYTFTAWAAYNGVSLSNPAAFVGTSDVTGTVVAKKVYITVQSVDGVRYFLDGIEFALTDMKTQVSVGQVFTMKISDTSKYEGTPTIDGKTAYIVTEDGQTIKASGVSPITPVEPPAEGLGLTEILLIVLVILIAIMVVVLLIRLNRS